jgi:hypothetical protein
MSIKTSKILGAAGAIAVIVGLPVIGHWLRHREGNRCALDGVAIDAIYRVRVVDDLKRNHEFCCLKCAELWLAANRGHPQAIYVTDEATGEEIEADRAFYVWSTVVTRPTTQNCVHAFAREADARKHAELFWGRVLEGEDRLFLKARR